MDQKNRITKIEETSQRRTTLIPLMVTWDKTFLTKMY